MIANAFFDLYLIYAYPHYALKVFGTTFSGLAGEVAKFQSPVLHTLIGYGFIRQRRWSYWLFMAYAAVGIASALVNFALLGFGRIRTIFLVLLILFAAYVYSRRKCFDRNGDRDAAAL